MRKGGRRDFLDFNSFTLHWEVTLGNDAFYVLCMYFVFCMYLYFVIFWQKYICVCAERREGTGGSMGA